METGNVFSCEPKGDGGKLCGQVGTRVRAHGFSTILKFDKGKVRVTICFASG